MLLLNKKQIKLINQTYYLLIKLYSNVSNYLNNLFLINRPSHLLKIIFLNFTFLFSITIVVLIMIDKLGIKTQLSNSLDVFLYVSLVLLCYDKIMQLPIKRPKNLL